MENELKLFAFWSNKSGDPNFFVTAATVEEAREAIGNKIEKVEGEDSDGYNVQVLNRGEVFIKMNAL